MSTGCERIICSPVHRCYAPLGAALAFSKILEPQEVVRASDLYGTIFGTPKVVAQPVHLTTTQFSHPAFVSVTADGRPRQQYRFAHCVAREGIFARRAKTNLPMCLRRCESSSLGRFAERDGSWPYLSAAEVPCKTAPFASFSDRAEKGGPARPERGPISSSVVKTIKKGKRNGKILRNCSDTTASLFRQADTPFSGEMFILLPSGAASAYCFPSKWICLLWKVIAFPGCFLIRKPALSAAFQWSFFDREKSSLS